MIRILGLLLVLLTTSLLTTSCGSIVKGLRPDVDDTYASQDNSPTSGGRWAEAGMLNDDQQGYRNSPGPLGGQGSWIQSSDSNANRAYVSTNAQDVSYSNTPNYMAGQRRNYKNGQRATRADFIDDVKVDGSLWNSDGQTNYYLTKNKIRGVGDIVSIVVDDGMVADIATEIKRSLTPEEREMEIEVAQAELKQKAMGQGSKDATAGRAPAAEEKDKEKQTDKKDVEVPEATFADVDLKKNIELKTGENIMAEVLERYPNGNYKIRGVKRVRYKNGYRMMNVLAIAKNSDITEDDQIQAGKLYEYRLEAIR